MKLIEAISKIDNLKHNTFTHEDKVGWLSRLDHMVCREILDTHEGGGGGVFRLRHLHRRGDGAAGPRPLGRDVPALAGGPDRLRQRRVHPLQQFHGHVPGRLPGLPQLL